MGEEGFNLMAFAYIDFFNSVGHKLRMLSCRQAKSNSNNNNTLYIEAHNEIVSLR